MFSLVAEMVLLITIICALIVFLGANIVWWYEEKMEKIRAKKEKP